MITQDHFFNAVSCNDLKALKVHFKFEFIYYCDKNGFTGFLQACNLGYVDIVRFFLLKDIDLEHSSPNGWNGLHWAAGNGNDEVVLLLLKKGANKEAETCKKYRPIHCAVVGGHVDAVRVLLAYGCDIEARNKDGKTPMKIAVELEHEECQALLKKWIESDKSNSVGFEYPYLDQDAKKMYDYKSRDLKTKKPRGDKMDHIIEYQILKHVCKRCMLHLYDARTFARYFKDCVQNIVKTENEKKADVVSKFLRKETLSEEDRQLVEKMKRQYATVVRRNVVENIDGRFDTVLQELDNLLRCEETSFKSQTVGRPFCECSLVYRVAALAILCVAVLAFIISRNL